MSEAIPFDKGHDAYRAKVPVESNPYEEEDWQHGEWCKGWSDAEECDTDSSWSWEKNQFVVGGTSGK